MPQPEQSYATHRRYDPSFHVFVFGVFAVNALLALWYLVRGFSFQTVWGVVTAAAMIVLLFKLRLYPLKVQDRVIRLEERLRLAGLLPEPLRARVGELSASQLTGIRFAADAEVPALFEAALAEKLSGEEIKKRIRAWRPDHFRV
jgi:hypothetical protein